MPIRLSFAGRPTSRGFRDVGLQFKLGAPRLMVFEAWVSNSSRVPHVSWFSRRGSPIQAGCPTSRGFRDVGLQFKLGAPRLMVFETWVSNSSRVPHVSWFSRRESPMQAGCPTSHGFRDMGLEFKPGAPHPMVFETWVNPHHLCKTPAPIEAMSTNTIGSTTLLTAPIGGSTFVIP
jgi:hypothetical protein